MKAYFLLVFVFSLLSCSFGQLVKNDQLNEVLKLRTELSEQLSPALKVTPAKQAEVDAIRNEILNAVTSKKYKYDSPSGSKDAKDGDKVLGSPLWNRIKYSQKNLIELVATKTPAKENETKPDIPEIENVKFLGKFNLNSNSYRDVIDLVEINENLQFEFEKPVKRWRTISNSLSGNRHLLLGITNTSLVLAKLIGGHFHLVDEMHFAAGELNHNGFEAFLYWNNNAGESEGYAILAVNSELLWIRLGTGGGEFNKLEVVWRWPIYKAIVQFKYFKHKNLSLIFIAGKTPSLDVYRFNLENREFSQIQNIRLQVPCKNMALVEWKKQLLMAIPVVNTTQIYKYTEFQFTLIQTVESIGVTQVAGFQAGGLCFFAIGGQAPKIMRYRNNGLNEINVIGELHEFVKTWIPIPIHTFRDDVLLLVQYEVKLGMHVLSTIGTLRWNGDAFEMFYNVPCFMDDVLHYNGINCLIDADEELGLSGSVVLAKSYNVSMLVPRKNTKSGLFDFKIEIRAAPHPKEEKLIDIQMMFDYFANLKEYNKMVLENAQTTIKNALHTNQETIVTGSWFVEAMEAEKVVIHGAALNTSKALQERSIKIKNSTNANVDSMERELGKDILEISNKLEYWDSQRNKIRFPGNGQLRIDSLSIHNSDKEEVTVFHPANGQFRSESIRDISGRPLSKRELKLDKIKVNNIEFDQVNGIPKEDLVFRLELESLHLNNTLEVDSLTVLDSFQGVINNIDFNKDLIHSQTEFTNGTLSFNGLSVDMVSTKNGINGKLLEAVIKRDDPINTIKIDSLSVDENLIADYINGVKWSSFSDQLIRRDLPTRIGKMVTGGNLVLGSDVDIAKVNNISFPNDFYWRTEKDFVQFTGKKTFKNSVVTDDIDMDESGLIDNVPQNRLISLSGGSTYFPNETVFADNLELIHGFRIRNTSKIEGPHMDKFLANPTLREDRNVKAACSFRYLRVNGKIILKGLINNIDLKESLDELVYITEKPIRINGYKEFKSAHMPYIVTNLFNGKELDSFVTLDTEQILSTSQLIANFTRFDYLKLDGLFDFVNLTEFQENSIKTSGDQVTEAHLIFQIPDDQPMINSYDLLAKNIFIRDTLNTFKSDVFLDDSNIFAFAGKLEAAEVFVDRLYLDGQLKGTGPVINGHNLHQYNFSRLSKTNVQTIQSPMIIQNLINSDFSFNRMNSVGRNELSLALTTMSTFEQDFEGFVLNEMHISETATFNAINGENMEHLLSSVVWLNQSNELFQDFSCLDTVWIENKISLGGTFNEENEFFSRVVWKDQNTSSIRLQGRFKFQKDVIVEGNIIAPSINAIAIDDLLTTMNTKFRGNVLLKGNLNVHSQLKTTDWMLTPTFSTSSLAQIYSYDFHKATHELHLKHVTFNKASRIPQLIIGGALNGIANIQEFIGGIVHFDSPKIVLKVPKMNLKRLHFHNLDIEFLNDHNLQQFLDHAIVHSEGSPVKDISGKIQFSNIIEAPTISVVDMVTVDQINGMALENWLTDTVYLAQSMVWEDPVEISSSNLKVNIIFAKELNGIATDRFDLKHIDVHLAGNSEIGNLHTNYMVGVEGFVNGLKLQAEEKNSFLSFGKTQKLTRTTFHEIRVMKDLTIEGFVNGINISRAVKIDGQPITIESPITFNHVQCRHLYTDHKISGIDFSSWLNETLKYNSGGEVQNITRIWHVRTVNVSDSISGEEQINGENLKGFLNTYNDNRRYLHNYETEMQFAYGKMCSHVKDYFSSPQIPGCNFKHFDFKLEFSTPESSAVQSMLIFQHLEDHFLIYSSGCISRLLRWNAKHSNFQNIDLIASGAVKKWIHVKSASRGLFLVAQNDGYCPNVFANGIWSWDEKQKLVPVKQMSSGRINDIEKCPFKRDSFYALDGVTVKEYQLPAGGIVGQWILNSKKNELRFVSNKHDSSKLVISDGAEVHTITLRTPNRYKRHWPLFNARSKRFEEKMKILNELLGMNKSEFLKNLKEALLMRKINAASKLIKPAIGDHSVTQKDNIEGKSAAKKELGGGEATTSSDPEVGGKLFDDIQNALRRGSELIVDGSMNVLAKVDDEKVDSLLDRIEDVFVTKSQNESDPIVQGALFDNIQDLLKKGSKTIVDGSMDILENADDDNVDNILDRLEDFLLTSPQNDSDPIAANGILLDTTSSVSQDDMQTLVDESADVLENISEGVILDEVLLNPQYPNTTQQVHEMHIQNQLSNGGNTISTVHSSNVFPHGSDIISIRVGSGSQSRTLFGVTVPHKIPNGNDLILIYEGLSIQLPFQSITCSNPSSLTAINLDQETLLIFLENQIKIQIYIFRGMMGFVKYLHIDTGHPVDYLTTTALPIHPDGCLGYFLTTVFKNKIMFLEAETVGHCVNEEIDCDGY